MRLAGLAQRERQSARPGDAGSTPAPRSIACAIADALALNPEDLEAGRRDGAIKAPFNPRSGGDLLAYAVGYNAGENFR